MEELLSLAKETVGIVSTATAKDASLRMIISSSIADIKRAGIKVDVSKVDDLIKNTIMLYVKANFGISNPDDKAKYMEAYQLHLTQLSLSSNYKEVENND